MYSPELLDHFQNPRNAGELDRPDAAAQVENPGCGDVLRLALIVSKGRIMDIKFKARGCVAVIACASALTERVKGQTVQEARRIQREELVQWLGGLPHASEHASHLAMDTLAAVLSNIKEKTSP